MRVLRSVPNARLPRAARCTALGLALLLAALLPVSSEAAAAGTRTVDIRQFGFEPKEIVVEPGTRVVWTNHDETPHTVTSTAAPKAFASPGMDTDDHFEFVFEREGDFAYLCTVHPMMTGAVHVHKATGKGR